MKIVYLALSVLCLINLKTSAQAWNQMGADIDGFNGGDYAGWSVSMPDAKTLAVAYYRNDDAGTNSGLVRVLTWNGSDWIQKGSLITGENAYDFSGFSLSMPDSNTLAIGADRNGGNGKDAGHVRIFMWSGGDWVQKGSDIDGAAAYDHMGFAVSMPDANTVAVGADRNDGSGTNAGHVQVYEFIGSAWLQKGLDIGGEAAGDQSGRSISMPDANTLAIGAPFNSDAGSFAGQVRIFTWDGNAWVQKGNDIDGESSGDASSTVSMPDANTIAIGAPFNSDKGFEAGHVRVYSWNNSSWVQKGADIDGETPDDQSGWSVSMPDANTLAIGSIGNSGNGVSAGHVRVFTWNGSSWAQRGGDIDGEAMGDQSGYAVSMPNANTVAIGAPYNDGAGSFAGQARVYAIPSIGIEENQLFANNFKVFPNPSNGEFSLSITNSFSKVWVSVSDISGKKVVDNTLISSQLSQFVVPGEAGIYFIKISNGEQTANFKIIKN